MDRFHLEHCDTHVSESFRDVEISLVSMEAEIPEVLYRGMKDFIGLNPSWDQYQLLSSAIAQFLVQNGCTDRAVTERYLDDLFTRCQVGAHAGKLSS
jgi:hypothetical protein